MTAAAASKTSTAVVTGGLVALLILLPFAIGGVHMSSGAIFQIAVWTLAALRFAHPGGFGAGPRAPFVALATLLVGYLALQIVPLPREALEVLAPRTLETYDATLGELDRVRVPDAPVPAAAAGDPVAPEDRERIRALARGAAEGASGGRTIALDPFAARYDLFLYVAYGLVLWIAATIPRPRILLVAIPAAGTLVSIVAILQAATWNGYVLWFFAPYDIGPMPWNRRLIGPFVNADHFAAFVAMSLAVSLALLADLRRGPRRPTSDEPALDPVRATLLVLAIAVMAAAILGSGSRGGIFGALLALPIVWRARLRNAEGASLARVPGRSRRNRLLRWRRAGARWGPLLVVALVIAAGVAWIGPRGRDMLDERIGRSVTGDDLETRLGYWMPAVEMIRDHPVTGIGLGGYARLFRQYAAYPRVGERPNHAHDDYLEWIAEVGAIGAALTLGLALAWIAWARANATIPRLVQAALLAALAVSAWQAIFDFALRVPANAMLVACVLGLLVNRSWRRPPDPDEESRPAAWWRTAAAVVVACGLALASVRFFREHRAWHRVWSGVPAIALEAGNAETWRRLGSLFARGEHASAPPAAECFVAAARLQPTAEAAFHGLARVLPSEEDRIRMLEVALRLDPTRSRWRLLRASLLESAGRAPEALAEVERAVRLDPVLDRHRYLVRAERKVAPEVVAAAERGFRVALDDHGEDPQILASLGSLLDRERRPAEAAAFWRRAAQASGDWLTYGLPAGQSFAAAKAYPEAEAVLLEVIREDPGDPRTYRSLALSVYQPTGRTEDAERILEAGAQRSARRWEIYLALSDFHAAAGRKAESLAALAQAAENASRSAPLHLRLGVAYLREKDYHRARGALTRAIRLDPAEAAAHFNLGAAEEALRNFVEARDAYREAVRLAPADVYFRTCLDRVTKIVAEGGADKR